MLPGYGANAAVERCYLVHDPLPFGTWLQEYRRAHDLTRQDLAQMIGCSIATIRKIESGERRPSKQIAQLLAERLDLSRDDRRILVEYARARPPPTGHPAAAPVGESHPPDTRQPAGSAYTTPNNLRTPLTSLIDRERELTAIRRYLVDSPVRLLTLVGPPGVGKTRLGLRAAEDALQSFTHGVYFVPLAQVMDPAHVLDAIARVVGLEGAGKASLLEQLSAHLHHKKMLLLLDNLEQVVDSAPQLLELLESCPDLKIVSTSRAPLHVRGEQQFEVLPLALPDLERALTAGGIANSPAIALFVERARAVEPEFVLNDNNAAAVSAICARLEGLPLPIELVAARVKMLPPQILLERMSGGPAHAHERLNLLTGGSQDLPDRHRTLRGAIGWSYNLLDERERRLFARLSVFSGGCTLVAIEAVCNPRGDLGASAFEVVASLLDKSLLARSHTSHTSHTATQADEHEARFAMLETIREYAGEQLQAQGETEQTRWLHAEYYLAMAEAADPQLTGADQKSWLDRLERDHDNLSAALEWALQQGDAKTAAHLGVALKRFWEVHNHFTEGRRWLEQILATPGDLEPSLMPKVLNAAGALAIAQSDYDEASSLLNRSLELQRTLGDDLGVAGALNNLGMVELSAGRYEEAIPLFEEGLSLLRKAGDKARISTMLGNFAVVMSQLGNLEQAEQLLRESLALRREIGNKWGVAAALGNLAEVARSQGDYVRAREDYAEVLVLLDELGDKMGIAKTLEGIAALDMAEGHAERAAKLLSVVDILLNTAGGTLSTIDNAEYMRLNAAIRSTLDEATLQRAWRSGSEMTLDGAIRYALGRA